jgi:hypothetical protein
MIGFQHRASISGLGLRDSGNSDHNSPQGTQRIAGKSAHIIQDRTYDSAYHAAFDRLALDFVRQVGLDSMS